MEAGSESEA